MEATTGADLNDPRTWGQYIPPPSDVERADFQKRIDALAGKSSSSGKSVLRLVWGYDEREWRAGDWRLRYACHTLTLPNGDKVDIGTPRWFLEELVEPAQYKEEWGQQRYDYGDDGVSLIDILGPAPEHGWYVPATLIAEHDEWCCRRASEDSWRKCWGKYRAPGADTLETIAKAVKLRNADKMYNRPDEPLSKEAFDECWATHYRRKDEADKRRSSKIREAVDQFISVYGGNFTSDDPARHHWGRYHFLTGHNLSGRGVKNG